MKVKVAVMAATVAFVLSASAQAGFGIPKLPGAGDNEADSATNWSELTATGNGALGNIYLGSKLLAESVADMAVALDLKDEAATLRAEAKNYSEDGSATGGGNPSETMAQAESVGEAVQAKLASADDLSDEQVEALKPAILNYLVGATTYVSGAKAIGDVASQAVNAPMLEKAKFIDVVAIAPDAASGMKSLVVNVPAFIKLFAGKNIAEQSDMEAMIKDF